MPLTELESSKERLGCRLARGISGLLATLRNECERWRAVDTVGVGSELRGDARSRARLGAGGARATSSGGVEAGRAGRFGYVVGVDRVGHAQALHEHGADVVVEDLSELLAPDEVAS